MRILLINPPRSQFNNIYDNAPLEAKHFIHKKLIGPPLGLLTVAAAIKEHEVTVLELKAEYDLDPDAPDQDTLVRQYCEKHNPDIVGVTVIASEFNASVEICRTVKRFNPGILTVAGGLHTTLCPQDFTDSSFDIICPGQCAHIFRNIVSAMEEKRDFQEVPGIIINRDGMHIRTALSTVPWNAAADNFIMPDRSLIKRWVNTYRVGGQPYNSTYLFTSLGCQYRCTFCSIWPQFDGRVYQREVESIIDELKTLDDYKIVRFSDANTVINPAFINMLCDRILEEGIDKHYVMDIRVDTVVEHPLLIEKLSRCGLKVVICGFESFKEDELQKYRKSSAARDISKAISILQSNGILIRGNYVVPHTYTEDDFKALADYASQHKVVYAGYTILTPMPGTLFYEEVKDQIVDFNLDKYNFFNCVFEPVLPLEKFYENVGRLWLIKKGDDVI